LFTLCYYKMSITQKILPYFPLSVFLLPGEDHPLRIFEPRYIQLIEKAREEGCTFAIPFVKDDQIQNFGCEVKLQQVVAENPSGRMVVTVEGISLVKIESFNMQLDDKLYAGGTVNILPGPDNISDRKLIELIMSYSEHFDDTFLNSKDKSSLNLNDLLVALNLSSEEKYKFTTLEDHHQKELYLIKQMHFLKLLRKQEQLLGNDFGLN
jgi:uncharacterized protein